jgi:hypothetical protein
VAEAIRDHQLVVPEWSFGDIVRELHRWAQIFDVEFKLERRALPIFAFSTLRNAYATYEAGPSEIGTRDTISFDYRDFTRGGPVVLGDLLHELLHLWQRYFGRPGSGNYHNREFRGKALACGLVVDARGCTSGYREIFISVLVKHGVRLDLVDLSATVEAPFHAARRTELKMKKWSCGCTNVRCAVNLNASCDRCKSKFHRSTA